MNHEHYYILSPHFNNDIDTKKINADTVGQKSKGLLETTSSIVPPFAVIFSEVFNIWYSISQQKAELLLDTMLKEILLSFKKKNVTKFIVRSSAKFESFEERGFYKSSESTDEKNLKTTIIKTWFENVEYFRKFPENKLAIIIQEFIKPIKIGHISNERRISRSKTNVLYEIVDDKNNFVENRTFSLSSNKNKYEFDLSHGLKSKNKKELLLSIRNERR